jgi:CCR4-NOT transcription complex subunit 6
MAPLALVKCLLPTGEGVYCGVQLEPYCLLKRGEQTVTIDDVPEEGSPEGVYQLRIRWYRSTLPRGGAVCSVHPEKEASMQCMVCLRHKVPQHLSYHCSVECLKSHWHLHKDYHKQQPSTANGAGG